MLDAVQSCTGIGNSKLCRWRLAGKELTKALGKRILEEKALQSHEFSWLETTEALYEMILQQEG